jgi:hypothetical protein
MSVFIDDGDLEAAQAWMLTAERLAKSTDIPDLAPDYLGAQVDLALLLGNYKKAREYVDLMDQCAPRYQATRSLNDLFIYRLRVQQFCGEDSHPELNLERLLRYHDAARALTRHDDHVEVLWQTLNATGDSERASALLSEYLLHYRRERRPCRYLLRMRTQSDPAWKLVRPSAYASGRTAV